jgi:hypothetical protein
MDIVAFEKSIGGYIAAACAVSATVWEKNGESMHKEQLGVSRHAEAVVS